MYMITRIVSNNTYLRRTQNEVLNNSLFLNKKLHLFRKSNPLFHSFFKKEDKIPSLFGLPDCERAQGLLFKILSCGGFDASLPITAGCCFWHFWGKRYRKYLSL